MKLISEIAIKAFRSLRDCSLDGIGEFTAFAGLNNSGKSNVLRALNAFFNEETEPGRGLDVDLDYHRPDLRKKRAKCISISVTFSLPPEFRFHHQLEAVEQMVGKGPFRITKEWTRGDISASYQLNGDMLDLEGRQRIEQFLSLINFRYIPNRVLPIDVIRDEHRALRDVLVRRLSKRVKGQEDAFKAIRETSDSLIKAMAKRFRGACPGAGAVRLAAPSSWNDLAFTFGYRLVENEVELEDFVQGSGIQSLLMFETLYLIDKDYFQRFGWRQAAIWAVEEPESSLHSSLEANVAAYLTGIASDPNSRLQVMCTTHSDLMLQYADATVVCSKTDGGTELESVKDKAKALELCARIGVSRWVHPILRYPLDPLVLVEGKHDHVFLEEAFRLIRRKRKREVRVAYLEQLEGSGHTGGVDALYRYVKSHARAVKLRAKQAPVIVVVDWDVAARADTFRRLFDPDAPFAALGWPTSALNPKLGTSFRGIERAYSDRMIAEAEQRGVIIGRARNGRRMIEKVDYGSAKATLFVIVKEGLRSADIKYAKPFVEEILREAGALQ